ncbi:MAG: ATP-dependent 6-phosphofructokinase [Candidatus Kappaea frigidicola]|nr:ATP-dependent 6-phosphofructokinase [Candidatus Kappaea frigidicola]
MAKRIGVLTGGGDCPGLNPVIRAVTRKAINEGLEVIGIKNGWSGLVNNQTVKLDLKSTSGILHRGGTILGTSRTNPYKDVKLLAKAKRNFRALKLTALIAIGGEDTLGIAGRLSKDGFPVVGVPKTIDNDVPLTDATFGFDTAVNIATEAIDRLHTTAESHHRVMVVEVMGRHAGWIAVDSAIAGGGDYALIPEIPINTEELIESIKSRKKRGKHFSIIVVAEGAKMSGKMILQDQEMDAFGHVKLGGIGQQLADIIEKETGYETRVTVLGHLLRGGSPTAHDRILGTKFGVKAVELILAGKAGYMVSLQGNKIGHVKIERILGKLKTVDKAYYDLAKEFFG